MRLETEIKTRLLESIEASRLVIVCGAGLSMAGCSKGPSAARVAEICFDEATKVDPAINTELRSNLDALAEHFADAGSLETYFIPQLVPWKLFVIGKPNPGHFAIADLAFCNAVEAAITTNYDTLVEEAAKGFLVDLRSTLDREEAATHHTHANFIKLHGCAQRSRESTVWTPSQLKTEAELRSRLDGLNTWLKGHLFGKDYVFVGFWSDWRYLNDVLAETLSGVTPQRVIVVDPASKEELQAKAPSLWSLLTEAATFDHVAMSGDAFLTDLRCAFSQVYLRKVFRLGEAEFQQQVGVAAPVVPIAESENVDNLHHVRCDAEGVPRSHAANMKAPSNSATSFAFAHLLLAHAGAQPDGANYTLQGRRIRIINGAGQFIPRMKATFADEPQIQQDAEIVLCAGGDDAPVPGNIIRDGTPATIIRPGQSASWLDLSSARQILEI
jgi:hypothetical protein